MRTPDTIAAARLRNQRIDHRGLATAADVVSWFGAVQAQEYGPARWGLAQRMRGEVRDADLQRDFDEGRLLRTHVLRPTWHFVAPADIRWMIDLTAPQIRRRMAGYERQLELDAKTISRGIAVLERALGDEIALTRSELAVRLRRARLDLSGIRLALFMMQAELACVVCSGPRRGKQFTYALVARRAPDARPLPRDESLAELARRFFRSHGPATTRDFMWWSGLAAADAKRGMEMVRLARHDEHDLVYWSVAGGRAAAAGAEAAVRLLPIYDEYLVAYRDRLAVPHGPRTVASERASVTFQHTLVIGGHVAGTWRGTPQRAGVRVQVTPLRPLTIVERAAIDQAVAEYGAFLGVPADWTL
jgi:hypothetical protein